VTITVADKANPRAVMEKGNPKISLFFEIVGDKFRDDFDTSMIPSPIIALMNAALAMQNAK
jgi:hypothetical protein